MSIKQPTQETPLSGDNSQENMYEPDESQKEEDSLDAKELCDKVFALKLGELGKFEEALKLFNKAIESDEEYARAWLNKGWALKKLEKDDEAIKCFLKALEIDKKLAEEWLKKEVPLGELTEEEVRRLLSGEYSKK